MDAIDRFAGTLSLVEPLCAPAAETRARAEARLAEAIAAEGRPRRVTRGRIALALAAGLLLAIGAGWALAPFDLRLFGEDGAPAPATVRELFAAQADSPTGALDLDTIRLAATFEHGGLPVSVYVAANLDGYGWATLYRRSDGLATGCSMAPPRGAGPLILGGCAPRDTFPGIEEVSGAALPPIERVTLLFEDGSERRLPVHSELFVYVAGGSRCEPGRRPAELVGTDGAGRVVERWELGPITC